MLASLREIRLKDLNGGRATKNQGLTSLKVVHSYHRKSAIGVAPSDYLYEGERDWSERGQRVV
jgi:hypothetical protein